VGGGCPPFHGRGGLRGGGVKCVTPGKPVKMGIICLLKSRFVYDHGVLQLLGDLGPQSRINMWEALGQILWEALCLYFYNE